MRLSIQHKTHYHFSEPTHYLIQNIHLTPQDSASQYICHWSLTLNEGLIPLQSKDAYGNIQHIMSFTQPLYELIMTAHGEVETKETYGVQRYANEPLPPIIYRRITPLTKTNEQMAACAHKILRTENHNPLRTLHAIMLYIFKEIEFQTEYSNTHTSAIDAFNKRKGVCQDHTHIFIALARCLNIPARYVSGYLHRIDGQNNQNATHAWAEAYIEDLGWVGFDPANGISPSSGHVALCYGLDYKAVAPTKGIHNKNIKEKMIIDIKIKDLSAH